MRLRALVLDDFAVKSVTILPQKVFPNVSANCVIFLLIKGVAAAFVELNLLHRKSELARLKNEQFDEHYHLDSKQWAKSVDKQFQVYQRPEASVLIHKMQARSVAASRYLDVMQGIVSYSIEQHPRDLITRRGFHSPRKLSNEYGPWIQGRCVRRYELDPSDGEYLRYGSWLHRPRKPKYFEGPRILVQEITGGHPPRIAACFCDKVLYHDPGIIACLAFDRT